MKKIVSVVSLAFFATLLFANHSYAFGYPRDNFQRMEEFVHQRDLIRNLRQAPYRAQFDLAEEEALFQNELRNPGKGYYCKPNKKCKSKNYSQTGYANTYYDDYYDYRYDYYNSWPSY